MKILSTSICFFIAFFSFSQDINVLIKEAINFELKFNEPDALNKYKQILLLEPYNYTALQKATELSCTIGARTKTNEEKKLYFESAMAFANRAFIVDSNNAHTYFLLATVNGKLTEIDQDNKTKIAFLKASKDNADKALTINPNHGKANFVSGKWHYEILNLSWIKKLAVKPFYGSLQKSSYEVCIKFLEKCRILEPYNIRNYLTLAKAYKENNQTSKMLEILNLLVKLPKRIFDDTTYLDEGKKMLADEQ